MKTLVFLLVLLGISVYAQAQDTEFESFIGRYDISEEWMQTELSAEQKKQIKARPVYLELRAIEGETETTYAAMLHDARTKRMIWEATWVADRNDYFDLVRVDNPDVVYNCNYTEEEDLPTITIFNYFGEDQPLVFVQNN